MVLPQRVTAEDRFQLVPPVLAVAAAGYQRAHLAERAQLALMAEQKLDDEWTDETRATVLLARQRILEAQEQLAAFREQVCAFAHALRDAGESASVVLRLTRSMIRLLESNGVVDTDDGRLEAEAIVWATEAYEAR
jgi:glycine/D-amino acid oxidase-like deaminating enzyme